VSETGAAQPFVFPVRVYYEDTDAGGVVYYANYLRFMERARTEWLRALGFEQDELAERERVIFAVRAAAIEFLKPARFNERLETSVEIGKRGHASITFVQQVRRKTELLCRGEIRVACLAIDGFTPCALPTALVRRLDQTLEGH
jgi:acyl-CoA thioester hydrolase